MANTPEILWSLCEHELKQVRHFQEERRAIANTVLILAGAIMAIVGLDKTIDASDRPMGGFLIALGLFGLLCMIKCHERIRYYQERSKVFAGQLDALLDGSPIKLADAAPTKRNWFLRAYCRFYLWLHWVLMFAAVIALGVYVLRTSSSHAVQSHAKASPTEQQR